MVLVDARPPRSVRAESLAGDFVGA